VQYRPCRPGAEGAITILALNEIVGLNPTLPHYVAIRCTLLCAWRNFLIIHDSFLVPVYCRETVQPRTVRVINSCHLRIARGRYTMRPLERSRSQD
jgi:hypothetical protein